ncbi:hypothetical protein [Legionella rowbothamii]|uniref:hypothetical protein n=1 Tax=Legionella rowbothamii TaxID=96229 RepID=UPI001056B474|nr:hypothetical protein [Legionella rowbothamii]
MKKYFLGLLIVTTQQYILKKPIIPRLWSIDLDWLSNKNLKIIFFFGILFFLYWTYEELIDKKITDTATKNFLKKLHKYIEAKKIPRNNNLIEIYPTKITPHRNLYYINGFLVLKVSDNFYDGEYKPPGYALKVGRTIYSYLVIRYALETIFKFFPYVGLFLWSLTLISFFSLHTILYLISLFY